MGLLAMVGDHLTAEVLPSFETIALSWTSKPLANLSTELPAALYYLDGVQSEASPSTTVIIQPGDYRLAVLLVCAVADFEDLQAELRAGLVGFEAEGDWDPIEHDSGEMLQINESIIWWRDYFVTRKYQQ